MVGTSGSKFRLPRLVFGGLFFFFMIFEVVARPMCFNNTSLSSIFTNSCWFFLGWGFFLNDLVVSCRGVGLILGTGGWVGGGVLTRGVLLEIGDFSGLLFCSAWP